MKPASLYYHAPGGKEELWNRVIDRAMKRHKAALTRAAAQAGTNLMKLDYVRVSTCEQNLDFQLDALKNEGCKHLFSDKVSGVKAEKPNFNKLLEYAREGDTIVVWKLDRLGRSTVQLIELIEKLKQRGVHLKSLQESIDTTTAMGNMFFQLMCILAEHERNIIQERTQAGLAS